ncbi:MAG: FAD-binding dehydrogenase, partial [Eggerthella lenta]
LLTTGGYSANPAMLSSLSPITTASVTALGYNQYNTGDGIKAALWAGAVKDITSATMIFDRGLVAPGTTAGYTEESVKAGNPQWPGNGQFNPGTQPFLKVNLRGERFALESADYDYLPHAAAQQPGGVYISVWDGNFGDDVQRFHTLAARPAPARACWA